MMHFCVILEILTNNKLCYAAYTMSQSDIVKFQRFSGKDIVEGEAFRSDAFDSHIRTLNGRTTDKNIASICVHFFAHWSKFFQTIQG